MNDAARITAGTWRGILAALALVCALAATSARADKQVIFAPLTDGPDFDDAMEFLSGYLKPEEYNTARRLEGIKAWKLGATLDLYLREFIKMGKGDIDDDGVAERFYFFGDPGWCGSRGCSILIVQKRPAGWKVLCDTSGGDHSIWITDWVDTSGYRQLQASFRVYWHGDKCYDDDPELLNEYKPEDYPRPPTERHWKPLQ